MNFITKAVAIAAMMVVPSFATAAVFNPLVISGSNSTFVPPAPANPINNVDITAPDTFFQTVVASGTGTVTYNFKALSPLIVSNLSFTTNGTAANVAKTYISFNGGPDMFFTPFGTSAASTGSLFFSPFTMNTNDIFTYVYGFSGPNLPTLMTGQFSTTPIPVPAALPLLLGGIAALGVASRKKRPVA